jgi:hypothetical protein
MHNFAVDFGDPLLQVEVVLPRRYYGEASMLRGFRVCYEP